MRRTSVQCTNNPLQFVKPTKDPVSSVTGTGTVVDQHLGLSRKLSAELDTVKQKLKEDEIEWETVK